MKLEYLKAKCQCRSIRPRGAVCLPLDIRDRKSKYSVVKEVQTRKSTRAMLAGPLVEASELKPVLQFHHYIKIIYARRSDMSLFPGGVSSILALLSVIRCP
jgi:hypothetical protein